MKKFTLGFITAILTLSPIFVYSASSLSEKLKGRILLAVEDKGKTYFVHEDGNRYRITKDTAQKIFEKLALGISNQDLEQIPLSDVGIDPEQKDVIVENSNNTELQECKTTVTAKNMVIEDYKKVTDDLMAEVNDILEIANNQLLETEKWKKLAYEQTSVSYEPVYVPITKCFYSGSTVACYDVNQFPKELNDQLEALDNNPYLSQTTREGKKLQAIQNYFNQ